MAEREICGASGDQASGVEPVWGTPCGGIGVVVRRRRPVPFWRTSQTSETPRDGERANAIHWPRGDQIGSLSTTPRAGFVSGTRGQPATETVARRDPSRLIEFDYTIGDETTTGGAGGK